MPFIPDPRPAQRLRHYSMIPARAASITLMVLVLTSSAVGNMIGTIVNSN